MSQFSNQDWPVPRRKQEHIILVGGCENDCRANMTRASNFNKIPDSLRVTKQKNLIMRESERERETKFPQEES